MNREDDKIQTTLFYKVVCITTLVTEGRLWRQQILIYQLPDQTEMTNFSDNFNASKEVAFLEDGVKNISTTPIIFFLEEIRNSFYTLYAGGVSFIRKSVLSANEWLKKYLDEVLDVKLIKTFFTRSMRGPKQ